MKKILFFLLLLFCIPVHVSGITGDGSLGSPYSGPLTTDMTWSGTVYVNGDVTVDGFTLTISPGAIIIFLASGSDIIVTGTGILTASGTATSMIRFTADFNNNGIYGETGERWGHISFQNMTTGFTGASIINYCIVEFGQKSSSPWNFESSGGGIQTAYSNLTISNSKIRNNYAGWGGGIYVNANSSPNIYNCLISNNVAGTTGGGLSIYQNSAALVENCVIENNTCNGGGSGGGVFVGDYPDNVKFYNCTIVSNSSTSGGINIRIWKTAPSTGPQFFNTIIWGNPYSINYLSLGPDATDFNNCAIQGYTTGYTNCINLSGTNSDPSGPNFINPAGGDYSIAFVSPCRDAGITPSPSIPTDILGNPRVGPYDIGAYELQYNNNLWTGATSSDWADATNWNPKLVPLTTSHVLIPPSTHDPSIGLSDVTINDISIESGSSLTIGNRYTFTATSVINNGTITISSGKIVVTSLLNESIFTVNPSAQATFTTLTNNGTINLNSDQNAIFSLIFDTYSGTGTSNIAMFLTGGGLPYQWNWHYVAVPASYRNNKTMFTSINPYDLIQYDDSQIPDIQDATDNEGWVYHDGFKTGDPPGGPYSGQGFTDLNIGKGYGFYHSNSSGAIVNFTGLSSLLNTLGSITLQYNGDGKLVPGRYGFNLMGNSLTCGIDWNLVTSSGNVNNVIYYTINYKIGSYVRGAPSGINFATQHIPPLQGFLVKTNELGTSLNFSSAREHTTQFRYKKSLEITGNDSKVDGSADPMIKLELNNSGNQDETLIWFNQNSTNSFDASYDGLKILSSGYDQIYSLSGSQKYGINAIPLPTETETIPLAVKFLSSGSNYKIIASQLQGLENYNITLTDKGNSNFITDLKNTGSYTFSSDAGTFPDRFVITIGSVTTGVSDVIIPDKAFNVFAYEKTLNIEVLNDGWEGKKGTINLYNLTGIKVLQQNNIEWYKGDIKKIPLNLPQGIYIVEIKAEKQKFVTKISIIR